MGKDATKHSVTLLSNIGQGTGAPTKLQIFDTANARSATGSTLVIKDTATTAGLVNVGNIIKYLNLCIEAGPRWITGDVATKDDNGWIEYALVTQTEREQDMASTNLGIQTLGDIATKQYRGDCLFTGCFPIGASQPASLDIKIKIPPKSTKMKVGSNMNLYYVFRSVNSADVRTDSHRVITSALYKVYS